MNRVSRPLKKRASDESSTRQFLVDRQRLRQTALKNIQQTFLQQFPEDQDAFRTIESLPKTDTKTGPKDAAHDIS